VQARWEVTQELLLREGVAAETLHGRGESCLAHMVSLIRFGDYVSFYLAMLNGVDPTPVEPSLISRNGWPRLSEEFIVPRYLSTA
jgi:hypothetical protein